VVKIKAYETVDASLIVLGTHDLTKARLAILAYLAYENFAPDSEEYRDALEKTQSGPGEYWVHVSEMDKERWDDTRVTRQTGDDWVPFLSWG
jgi:hypothetical protein